MLLHALLPYVYSSCLRFLQEQHTLIISTTITAAWKGSSTASSAPQLSDSIAACAVLSTSSSKSTSNPAPTMTTTDTTDATYQPCSSATECAAQVARAKTGMDALCWAVEMRTGESSDGVIYGMCVQTSVVPLEVYESMSNRVVDSLNITKVSSALLSSTWPRRIDVDSAVHCWKVKTTE